MNIETLIREAKNNYPEGYCDFSDGVDLSNSEITRYVEEAIRSCCRKIKRDNLKESFSTISTGNSKVLVEIYLQDNREYTIYVNVCKNYSSLTFCNVS